MKVLAFVWAAIAALNLYFGLSGLAENGLSGRFVTFQLALALFTSLGALLFGMWAKEK